jgi:hypothetical protein
VAHKREEDEASNWISVGAVSDRVPFPEGWTLSELCEKRAVRDRAHSSTYAPTAGQHGRRYRFVVRRVGSPRLVWIHHSAIST